jgi:hypothetical protein
VRGRGGPTTDADERSRGGRGARACWSGVMMCKGKGKGAWGTMTLAKGDSGGERKEGKVWC